MTASHPIRRLTRSAMLGIALCAIGCGGTAFAAEVPIVLELFQSQGCSSCPPADANINAVAGQPGVLALSFGVTYWDDLGWKDTFAKPQYTARQWDYAHAMHHGEVATPQVVVNGRSDLVGNDRAQLDQAIRAALRRPRRRMWRSPGTQRRSPPGRAPGAAPTSGWCATIPRVQQVPIQRGENGGRTPAAQERRAPAGQARRLDWGGGQLSPAARARTGPAHRGAGAGRRRRCDPGRGRGLTRPP